MIFLRDESKHIVKVLRKKEGDILLLTNGKGVVFETELLEANHNSCIAKVISAKEDPLPSYHLHMAVAPTKMNDRYEWFLEKATEIGVHEITPVICDHSERKVVKLNRYEKVLQSAMKQSLQAYLPVLNEPVSLKDFISEEREGQKFIAHCENSGNKYSLKNHVEKSTNITLLIGPEGDFSSEEKTDAVRNNWRPVSLGKTRLRTETAAIVACHTVALAQEE